MNKKKKIRLAGDVLLVLLLIAVDQTTKYFAVTKLMNQKPWVVWEGVFELHYLENRGAAFGMLQGQKIFFVLIAVIILAVIVYVLIKIPYQKMYTKLHITLVFIASGAIGNLIDRIQYDYVVDFLYFSLINFPIFNVADIYVTLSSIYLVILLLFVYKESDLEFLTFRTEKFRNIK
ncbi:MAG: signal peptidase II [Lachnospiraceae bacterium]|nr:signal peptidase II [Lachnospiraceae bacterium]MDE7274257.1 signal peptidase II [Lachnospiraceae bacterium]